MRSLLTQTERADIVTVDDGSTVPASQLLGDIDGVVQLRLPVNGGLVGALNHGIRYCLEHGYEYIARIDCGDTCDPERIAKQRAYMDNHPEVDLLGTLANVVDEEGNFLFVEGVVGRDAIRSKLWDNAAFKHPTFFFRAGAFERLGLYSADYLHADDYELMRRFGQRGIVECLDEVLVVYEKNTKGISIGNRRAQLVGRLRGQLDFFDVGEWRAYVGVLRTLLTLLVPAPMWSRISQFYWQTRERLTAQPVRQ
jgi:glycosyltransferase involved in cell wall biosynthesis